MAFSSGNGKMSRLDTIFIVALFLFILLAIPEFLDNTPYELIANSYCFPVIGCNAGFFGYDAVVHLVGGILWTVCIVWLMKRYKKVNLLHNNTFKSLLVIISVIALLHMGWELYEFFIDRFEDEVLGLEPTLHRLVQPSLNDTIGDLVFGMGGALIGILFMYFTDRSVLRQAENSAPLAENSKT